MAIGFDVYGMPMPGDDWGSAIGGVDIGATDPTIADTFWGDPAGLWQAARMQQLGDRAYIPQFQRTINQGFTPTYGQYLMGASPTDTGGTQTFQEYLAANTAAARAASAAADWAGAIQASRMLNPAYKAAALAASPTGQLTTQQLTPQGFLQGEGGRRNALAMAQIGLGQARGLAGQARQRALGNLYDIYAARARGVGQDPGGFLGYLSTQM